MSQNDVAFDPFGLLETTISNDDKATAAAAFQHPEITFIDFGDTTTTATITTTATTADNSNNNSNKHHKQINNNDVDDIAEVEVSPPSPPPVSRVSRNTMTATTTTTTTKGTITMALPPKISIRLSISEEVSSTANLESEGSSNVIVEGSVLAQVQCSDAMKNAPFCVLPESLQSNEGTIILHHNPDFFIKDPFTDEHVVKIPKHEIGLVPILKYTLNNQIQHMPLLLERKVTISGLMCRIAVQVRSKLTNHGNLQHFSIAVALPECINGTSIEITRGNGEYDELKRTIIWKLLELPKGESFMVSAQAKLWETPTTSASSAIQFPVLLRCSSITDQISDVEFKVSAASGYPSSITFNTTHSFRLLHRLS